MVATIVVKSSREEPSAPRIFVAEILPPFQHEADHFRAR
jgi:hypothetical protein